MNSFPYHRITATLRAAGLWIAALLIIAAAGCSRQFQRPPHLATHSDMLAPDTPGIPMPRRLELIAEAINPDEVLNENRKKAAVLKAQVQEEKDPQLRRMLLPQYAQQLLLAGETDEAIRVYKELLAPAEHHPELYAPGTLEELEMDLALAYLRLGEQQNCLGSHTGESCILPIRGGGVHRYQSGSRNAIRVLTHILQRNPANFSAGWLLNLAYMTLGEYPAGVPRQWRIPPRVFQSDGNVGHFPNIASDVGLDLQQLSGGTIVEDFDNDGYLDVMISSIGTRDQLRLFHNNGDGTFRDCTKEAGLLGETGGLNIMQTDYDNDGFADVLVLRGAWFGKGGHWPLSLLHNNGNGTFTDVTEQAGLLRFHPTQAAVWFDYNGDGWLDLFVGDETRPDDENPCELFRNNGDGTFTNVAHACGVDVKGFVKGVASADFNNDGRPDLFISIQGHPNVLFRNDGPADPSQGPRSPWKFTDVTASAGVAKPINSFSCFFFDYDNDGWPDLFVSGYSFNNADVGQIARDYLGLPSGNNDYPVLYHNDHHGHFTDVTRQAHLHKLLFGMGINFGDLDNDGWLDFYVGTGTPDLAFLMPNKMFRNAAGRYFQDVTTSGGFGHLQKGHGISFADLRNNGQQDIFESMGGIYDGDTAFSALYRNPGHPNHWITLKLEGTRTNRAAIGARIKVTVQRRAGLRDIYKTVNTGGSFGANPLRQEIGLGDATAIRKVEIFWPVPGETQVLTGLKMDRFYQVRQGAPAARLWPLRPMEYARKALHMHHSGMEGM